jgi:CubicO group peptidase (beta-lactamase class C family)
MRKSLSRSKGFWSLVLLFFLASFLVADEKTDQVDRIFAAWDTTASPGAALAIIKDGQIIYERGYGMAKIEDDIIMTPSKIFDIASVSKQFTAACVAVLAKEGKVSLDDDVRKYIPEMPRYEQPVTIKHLIYHASGLRDYTAVLELAGFRSGLDSSNVSDALAVIYRQKRLNYPPGEEYYYCNTGYFLLGQIVERASGKSLNEFAQEHIFKPLGMAHTLYSDDHTRIIKNRATGYSLVDSCYKIDMSNWDQTGDGNAYTSVEDLYFWDQAFYNNKLGQDLMDTIQTVGTLNDGTKIDYAFGLRVNEYKGLRVVRHTGSWAGFRAAIVRFPEQKFSVICLANLSSISPSTLSLKVADIYLADVLKEPPQQGKKKVEPVTLSAPELEEKAGNYEENRFHSWISLTVKEGKLTMAGTGYHELPLVPLSRTTFQAEAGRGDITLEFLPDAKGRPRQAVLDDAGEEATYHLTKAAPPALLTAEKLKEYSGDYTSDELAGATYRLTVENGNLVVNFRSIPKTPLKAMAPDKFTDGYLSLEFVRGKKNRITGFKLSIDSAANIEFVRK